MPRFASTALALSTFLFAGCQTIGETAPHVVGTASIQADGQNIGVGTVIYAGTGGSVSVALSGLSQGTYAVHLHETGSCSGDGLDSAGGHLNPAGSHLGDLPNIEIGPGGVGTVSASLPGTEVQLRAWLFDEDGTTIIVHVNADDYVSDPGGNAGARIACGVLQSS